LQRHRHQETYKEQKHYIKNGNRKNSGKN